MGLLAKQNLYLAGELLVSADWDAELDAILQSLGYQGNPNNYRIVISGQTDENNKPILKIMQLSNLPLGCLNIQNIDATHIVQFAADGVLSVFGDGERLVVSSQIVCPNLNAQYLGGVSGGLETDKNAFDSFYTMYEGGLAGVNPNRPQYIVGETGLTITKLKAQQRGTASGDAQTVIDFKKNGVSIGTVTINANTQAVQTNDVVDVSCVENDILSFGINTYAGALKHSDITASFHFKKQFKI